MSDTKNEKQSCWKYIVWAIGMFVGFGVYIGFHCFLVWLTKIIWYAS